ncbi:unnamed protein product [Meganyctiphanes norvegica]|uniref:SOCS box domain-containing protein n=1 Tax=Meganyctiphanes norvegica TaxID=48144 RepID=A0AAV2SR93_MEGNR
MRRYVGRRMESLAPILLSAVLYHIHPYYNYILIIINSSLSNGLPLYRQHPGKFKWSNFEKIIRPIREILKKKSPLGVNLSKKKLVQENHKSSSLVVSSKWSQDERNEFSMSVNCNLLISIANFSKLILKDTADSALSYIAIDVQIHLKILLQITKYLPKRLYEGVLNSISQHHPRRIGLITHFDIAQMSQLPPLQDLCKWVILKNIKRKNVTHLPLPSKIKGYLRA